MKFGRFIIVMVSFSVVLMLFGALIGGLLGFAIPERVASISTNSRSTPSENDEMRFNVAPGSNKLLQGTAAGAAVGLTGGLLIGLAVGVMDQVLLAWRDRRRSMLGPNSTFEG